MTTINNTSVNNKTLVTMSYIVTGDNFLLPGELDLKYQCATVEEIKEQFDLVVSSEVVEHVPCVKSFVNQCAQRVKVGFKIIYINYTSPTNSSAVSGQWPCDYTIYGRE